MARDPPWATGQPLRWPVKGHERVSRDPAEQCPGLVGVPPASGDRGGQQRSGTEPCELDGVVGQMCDRAHEVVGQVVEVPGGPFECPPPPITVSATETLCRPFDRPPQESGLAGVERMGAVDLRPAPPQAVALQTQPAQVRRANPHRVERRAVVVQDTRKRQLAGPGTTTDAGGAFEDGDIEAGLRETDRGGESVRAGSDHHRCAHPTAATSSASPSASMSTNGPRVQVTCKGMGPSGSQGSWATASATW